MKIFASRSRPYQAALMVLLLALVIVFVCLARWRSAQYDVPPRPYGVTLPPTIPESSARVEAGAGTQEAFTLLAVTRTGQRRASPLPPNVKPEGLWQIAESVNQDDEGTGLWIDVQGGLGVLTRAVPVDGVRHVLPFGPNATFVATLTPPTVRTSRVTFLMMLAHYLLGRPLPPLRRGGGWSGTSGWFDRSGLTPLPADSQPFVAENLEPTATAGSAAKFGNFLFVPRRLSDVFRITAQPQTALGTPLGPPVSLESQPVNAHVLFVALPAAYSDRTRRITVTVTRAANPADRATWRLTDLPTARRNGPDARPSRTAVSFGSLSIQASAEEAEDRSGRAGFWVRRPDLGAALLSADNHDWTGLPTLDYVLHLRNASLPSDHQDWTVRTERVTPQWTVPASPVSPGASSPGVTPGYVSIDRVYAYTGPSGGHWQDVERQVGAAYPGQQRWLQIDAVATRTAYRYETVTLHDADVAYDATAGHWRVSWRRAQRVTTPTGVSVMPLNAHPGPSRAVSPRWSGPGLRFSSSGDTAEMYLAWHLPPGLAGSGITNDGPARQAYPPGAFGPLVTDFDSQALPPTWHEVWLPGVPLPAPVRSATGRLVSPPTAATALGPLIHDGWQPLRYALRSATTSPTVGYSAFARGAAGATLPAHVGSLTFRVYFRALAERHPFTLVLPIAPRHAP